MTVIEQDILVTSSIGPIDPSMTDSDIHIEKIIILASEIGSIDSERTRHINAAFLLINIMKIITCSRAPPIELAILLDIISSAFPSDQEIWDCIYSDHPAQIGIT